MPVPFYAAETRAAARFPVGTNLKAENLKADAQTSDFRSQTLRFAGQNVYDAPSSAMRGSMMELGAQELCTCAPLQVEDRVCVQRVVHIEVKPQPLRMMHRERLLEPEGQEVDIRCAPRTDGLRVEHDRRNRCAAPELHLPPGHVPASMLEVGRCQHVAREEVGTQRLASQSHVLLERLISSLGVKLPASLDELKLVTANDEKMGMVRFVAEYEAANCQRFASRLTPATSKLR